MELLMPVLLIFILGGFFLYNPVRKKYSSIIGVGGSYIVAIGLILVISLICAIFSPSMRASMDGGVVGLIIYIVLALLTVAYLAFIMMTRCTTVMQRVMLPFVILIIAFGFATRMLASLVFHLPMESGEKNEFEFPKYIYDDAENPWELMNSGADNATYHCQKTGEISKVLYKSDFEYGAPSGFHLR